MDWLGRAIAQLPDDPLALALGAVAVWLPICTTVLVFLVAAAAIQNRLVRSRRTAPALVLPPVEARPLVLRRTMTGRARGGGFIGVSRLTFVVGLVAALTALFLAASSTHLLGALPR